MSNALVLMKAMPPTRGHERLIDFAVGFSREGTVLMDTAPGEPFVDERTRWLGNQLALSPWQVRHLTMDDQNPNSDGFWERWKGYIDNFGKFDYVIGSEPYCAKVAEVIGASYIPYDPDRELADARGTEVRQALIQKFAAVAPGFQRHLQTTVTIFGAESTGKTTLSHALANKLSGEWVFEWARPYLEGTGRTVCDLNDMHNIWHGQYAVEENAVKFSENKPFVIRDTDLYSTIGYWEQPHWIKKYGPVPMGLLAQASLHKADLYILTKADIPFEKDPLRYGGDHRESPDSYWVGVAEKYDLPYIVLTGLSRHSRLAYANNYSLQKFYEKNAMLTSFSRGLVQV